jgi:hypothetical protein
MRLDILRAIDVYLGRQPLLLGGGSGDSSIGRPPRKEKYPGKTKHLDPRSRRTLHNRDPGLRQLGDTLRVLTAGHEQKIKKGAHTAHCEPVMLVTPPSVVQPWVRDATSTPQDVTAVARPGLKEAESREL